MVVISTKEILRDHWWINVDTSAQDLAFGYVLYFEVWTFLVYIMYYEVLTFLIHDLWYIFELDYLDSYHL